MLPRTLSSVERDAELTTLITALRRTPGGAVVEGEPGVGKTHLVRQALGEAAAPHRQVLVGHARPAREAYPLGPVVEALASAALPPAPRLSPLAGALREVLPDRAEALPPAPPPTQDPLLARHRLLRAAAELLGALGSTILVLEDLHWADDATVELLGMLGARPPPHLSLALTYRPCDLAEGARLPAVLAGPLSAALTARVRLTALSARGAAVLAAEVLAAEVLRDAAGGPAAAPTISEAVAERLHRRSGGVPLVVREDACLLHARGLLRHADSTWTLTAGPCDRGESALETAIPPAVGASVIERANRLSVVARAVLDAAAVLESTASREPASREPAAWEPAAWEPAVWEAAAWESTGALRPTPTQDPTPEPARSGLPVGVELLAAVAGLDARQTSSGSAEALRAGLLREAEAGVALRHELARHAVCQALGASRRRALHAAAAEAFSPLSSPGLADRVAAHFRRAGRLPAWVRAAEAAADIAIDRGDLTAANRLLRDVLEAGAAEPRRRAGLAIKIGWTAPGADDDAQAVAFLLTDALGSPYAAEAERGELRLLRAWLRMDTGEPSADLVAEIEAAVAELPGRPDLRAMALASLALPARLPEVSLPAQLACLSRARAALRHTADPVARAFVSATAVSALMATGATGAWRAVAWLPEPGSPPAVSRQVVRGLLNAADAALHLGSHRRARDLAEQGLALAAGLRMAAYDQSLRITRLRARWAMGEPGAAEEAERLGARPGAGAQLHSCLHAGLLAAQVLVGRGELDSARGPLREVAERACASGELAVAAHAVAELSRSARNEADRQAAHALTARLLDAVAAKQIWSWAAPVLPFGHLGLVRDALRRCRAGTAGREAPIAHAALSFADGRLAEAAGDLAPALERYADSHRRYAALPDPRMAAHAATAESRCRIAAGRPADGELLLHAWSVFTRLNASWDANRVKQLIRRAGLPTPHRRGRPGYGNRLSPREREIAGLAAAGHTNRDIAGRLFLSSRTVKYHLANAMRKLEVTSRRQLPQALASDQGPGVVGRRADHVCRCASCGRELAGN